jgi:cyclophilin family peptidyl-prolyl cis-trans isomerase
MQAQQQIFNQLVAENRSKIMELRRNRDQEGLMELQNDLVAQTQAIAAEQPSQGLTEAQQQLYSTVGGTPHLDGQYTVFGEVIEGLDVVGNIQETATRPGDRPKEDIFMNVCIIEE